MAEYLKHSSKIYCRLKMKVVQTISCKYTPLNKIRSYEIKSNKKGCDLMVNVFHEKTPDSTHWDSESYLLK